MKAIVLSCDRYRPMSELMIRTYQTLWPSNPFTFIVSYNKIYPQSLKNSWGDKVHAVKTPVEFKKTAEELLRDIDDNEWVFWASDDSYVISIYEKAANATYEFVKTLSEKACGVTFYKGVYDRKEKVLDTSDCLQHAGYKFCKKKKMTYLWQHQFYRAKVVKKLFRDFPREPDYPKEMDIMLRSMKSFWDLPSEADFYSIENNAITLGEPTSRGKLTLNGVAAFKEYGLSLPVDFEIGEKTIFKK